MTTIDFYTRAAQNSTPETRGHSLNNAAILTALHKKDGSEPTLRLINEAIGSMSVGVSRGRIMGEYLGRLHLNVNRRPQYTVRGNRGSQRSTEGDSGLPTPNDGSGP